MISTASCRLGWNQCGCAYAVVGRASSQASDEPISGFQTSIRALSDVTKFFPCVAKVSSICFVFLPTSLLILAVASDYQHRLATIPAEGDPDHYRRKMYVEEVACLGTVTHHYLAITKWVIEVRAYVIL